MISTPAVNPDPMNKLTLRKIHRYLGLIAGIQLLAWTLSGLYFTLIPIDEIRGSHLLDKEREKSLTLDTVALLSPSAIAEQHQLTEIETSSIRLTTPNNQPVWLIGDDRYDAITGDRLPLMEEAAARELITARSSSPILSMDEVHEVTIDDEYRGGELPAWRATLGEPANAAIYVGMTSGQLRAVRTDEWRLFDFLWSLHIMDYEEREDFNHLLIQALAGLGLLTVLSGLVLFFLTQRWSKP